MEASRLLPERSRRLYGEPVTTEAEVAAVRERAGFWPLPDVGVLVATGKDRVSWTNGMVSNDIAGVPDGGAM